MKVIKKINNNVAICKDNNGQELVALGKGIGFPKVPYTLTDLSKIDMTFYRVNTQILGLLKSISEESVMTSSKIVKYAHKVLGKEFSPNVVFSLADHISFAIERAEKKQYFDFSLSYDIEHLYAKEYQVGIKALDIVKNEMNYALPKTEAVAIAMHFINAERDGNSKNRVDSKQIIFNVTKIIENKYQIRINKESFSYQRFVVHMKYLIERLKNNKQISDEIGQDLINDLSQEDKNILECATDIIDFIDKTLKVETSDNEMFYLMLYINRLVLKSEVKRNGEGL